MDLTTRGTHTCYKTSDIWGIKLTPVLKSTQFTWQVYESWGVAQIGAVCFWSSGASLWKSHLWFKASRWSGTGALYIYPGSVFKIKQLFLPLERTSMQGLETKRFAMGIEDMNFHGWNWTLWKNNTSPDLRSHLNSLTLVVFPLFRLGYHYFSQVLESICPHYSINPPSSTTSNFVSARLIHPVWRTIEGLIPSLL